MKKIFFILLIFVNFVFCTIFTNKIVPPIALERENENMKINDAYYWMKDINNPEVMKYIDQENKYTEHKMADTKKLQEQLFNEFISRIKENDFSVPYKYGHYFYYSKTVKGKNYRIYCRKKNSLENKEEIIFDANKFAEKFKFFDIGSMKISPDENILAFTIDTLGNEDYILLLKNLTENKIINDTLKHVSNFIWGKNNKEIYYAAENKIRRPYKILKHYLLSKEDKVLFEDNDDKFWVWIDKSANKRFLFINSASKNTSYVLYKDLLGEEDTFKIFKKKEEGTEYYLENHDDYFYIFTNKNAKNFKILKCKIDDLKKIESFIDENDTITLNEFIVFNNYMVISERSGGNEKYRVYDFNKQEEYYIKMPENSYSVFMGTNKEYNTDLFRFSYTSFISPSTVYDFDMNNKKLILKKQYEVKGYDKKKYISEYIFVKNEDGIKIPISIVYRKDLDREKAHFMILNGYGAYGNSSDPYFSSIRLSLLDRGIMYAIAHVRGGGELGKQWYEDGKMLNKKNTFYDFINCAEYLIEKGYTDSNKLIITGGSAGGLLIGAVLNMKPELFKGAIASVPFVDVLNTMMDSMLPLTATEYEEWGNPNNEKYFDYIKSYSPYDNVTNQKYPNILIMGNINDTRVSYWEPLKWTAKLRKNKIDDNLLLLKINKGGHSGMSGRYNFYREIAFEYAFIFKILNLNFNSILY